MPHQEIREENTREVINTALKIFMEKGVEEATVPQIAREAGLSLSSVYRYFKNKGELVTETFSIATKEIEDEIEKMVKSKEYAQLNGADSVIYLCRQMLVMAKDNAKFLVCLNEAESYLTRLGKKDIYSMSSEYDNSIIRHFKEAFEQGRLDGSISEKAATDERQFLTLAIVFRGFYHRIAKIYSDEELCKQYKPEIVIDNYLTSLHHSISAEWVRRSVDGNEYEV